MALATFFILLYFSIRGILQVWIPRGLIKIKKTRVVLGIAWLPFETIIYLSEIIDYMIYWSPGTLLLPPMPIGYFLGWIVFVVADILYQFHELSRMSVSTKL